MITISNRTAIDWNAESYAFDLTAAPVNGTGQRLKTLLVSAPDDNAGPIEIHNLINPGGYLRVESPTTTKILPGGSVLLEFPVNEGEPIGEGNCLFIVGNSDGVSGFDAEVELYQED